MMFAYEVVYSKRRKALSIIVERDKRVVVQAPEGLPVSEISAIVEEKRKWIESKISDINKYDDIPEKKEFVSGETMMLLGRHYKLSVVNSIFSGIQFDEAIFKISKQSQVSANELFKDWYKRYALQKIEVIAKDFAIRLGVNYTDCIISENMKYRWASCTTKGNINFNWRIIKAPMFVIEYIIVHELVHLLEARHSDAFWNIVSVQVPRYIEAKEWLKINGGLLEIDF